MCLLLGREGVAQTILSWWFFESRWVFPADSALSTGESNVVPVGRAVPNWQPGSR